MSFLTWRPYENDEETPVSLDAIEAPEWMKQCVVTDKNFNNPPWHKSTKSFNDPGNAQIREEDGRFGPSSNSGITPENYKDYWKPHMKPAEAKAWAKAAGTKYSDTVVHSTEAKNIGAIKGKGFHLSKEYVSHAAGIYFSTDPVGQGVYSEQGIISAVVVTQNPLEVDLENYRYDNRTSNNAPSMFREAALLAAGVDTNQTVTLGEGRTWEVPIAEDAAATTKALRNAGYDAVLIHAPKGESSFNMVGGDQIIALSHKQVTVIGQEIAPRVGGMRTRDEIVADAFNKSFGDPGNTQQRVEGGRFGPSTGGGFTPDNAKGLPKASDEMTHKGFGGKVAVQDLLHTGVPGQAHTQTGIADWELKDQVVLALQERSGLTYERTNSLVAAWAGSASDTQADSIALQMAAAKEFGLTPTPYIQEAYDKMVLQGPTDTPKYPDPLPWNQRMYDATVFVRSMYDYTQETLKAQGISEVILDRGVGFGVEGQLQSSGIPGGPRIPAVIDEGGAYARASEGGPASLDQNPISSWTVNRSVAIAFGVNNDTGGGGYLLSTTVPIERILSTAATGIGCQYEGEATLLGGTGSQFGLVNVERVSHGDINMAPQAGVDLETQILQAQNPGLFPYDPNNSYTQ